MKPRTVLNRPSPNFGERKPAGNLDGISMLVVHYTGMESCSAAIDRLCDPQSDVSAHVVIDEDGTVYRLIDDQHRAWHAGRSYWRGIEDVNSASIGIELVNPGHDFGYRPYPRAQIDTLIAMAGDLIDTHEIPLWGICSHSDIAPGRKIDPGELFPWAELARAGIGVWPDDGGQQETEDLWGDLSAIGYARPGDPSCGSSILDPETAEEDVISAFQRRFRPSAITGRADRETRCLIRRVREVLF